MKLKLDEEYELQKAPAIESTHLVCAVLWKPFGYKSVMVGCCCFFFFLFWRAGVGLGCFLFCLFVFVKFVFLVPLFEKPLSLSPVKLHLNSTHLSNIMLNTEKLWLWLDLQRPLYITSNSFFDLAYLKEQEGGGNTNNFTLLTSFRTTYLSWE